MQVTKLERINEKKVRICLNDDPAFWLYRSELARYHIAEGRELSQEAVEEIFQTVLSKRAKLRCMHLLKTMDKTEYQLREKLRGDEYPQSVIDEAVEYVKSYHYVDDERYARNYIESRKEIRSRKQLQYDLQSRGVKKEVIDQVWEQTDPVDETEQILRWVQKKHFDLESEDQKERQKFYQFLQRKGFSYSDIKKALT